MPPSVHSTALPGSPLPSPVQSLLPGGAAAAPVVLPSAADPAAASARPPLTVFGRPVSLTMALVGGAAALVLVYLLVGRRAGAPS